jgi:hypothetical protein
MTDSDDERFVLEQLRSADPRDRARALGVIAAQPTPDRALLAECERLLDDREVCVLTIPYSFGEVRFMAADAVARVRSALAIDEPVRLANTFCFDINAVANLARQAGIAVKGGVETLRELVAMDRVPRRTITRGPYREAADVPTAPVVVSADEAERHGLAPLTIRYDFARGGMPARLFPTNDMYLALDGPPGGPISIFVWDCTTVSGELEDVVRARVTPPWATGLEIGVRDRASVFGAEHDGLRYNTDEGAGSVSWFAIRAERPRGIVLVSCGIGNLLARSTASTAKILGHQMIAAALAALTID